MEFNGFMPLSDSIGAIPVFTLYQANKEYSPHGLVGIEIPSSVFKSMISSAGDFSRWTRLDSIVKGHDSRIFEQVYITELADYDNDKYVWSGLGLTLYSPKGEQKYSSDIIRKVIRTKTGKILGGFSNIFTFVDKNGDTCSAILGCGDFSINAEYERINYPALAYSYLGRPNDYNILAVIKTVPELYPEKYFLGLKAFNSNYYSYSAGSLYQVDVTELDLYSTYDEALEKSGSNVPVDISIEKDVYHAKNGDTIKIRATVTYNDGHTSDSKNSYTVEVGRDTMESYNKLDNISVYKSPIAARNYWEVSIGDNNNIPLVLIKVSAGNIASFVQLFIDGVQPYDHGNNSRPNGGTGTFGKDEISDIIDFPIGSTEPNSSNAGLFTKYVMTSSQMKQLGNYFWSTDFVDSLERELISKMYGKPSDTIISIMAMPIDPRDFGIASNSSHIFFGSVDSGILSNGVLSNTAVNINWGSIEIEEYYGNFLDYAPHTKIELYLPWSTGFVSIEPNDVVGGSISVSTNLEFDKGTCTHIVSGKNGVIGTYDGVFGKQVPISALDTGGKYLTAVMGAIGATIAGTIAVGGAALSGTAAATTASNVAAGTGIATMAQSSYAMGSATQAAMSSLVPSSAEYMGIYAGKALPVFAGTSLAAFRTPSHVMRNGNFTGNTAGMNVQYPFIRVSRPTQSVPKNYGHYVGYPSNIYSKLGSLIGYTEVAAIHLDGFSATVDEQNEIAELLKGGVII